MAKRKQIPFVSVIPNRLRKPEIVKIKVAYEPERTRASLILPKLVTIRVNGKKLQKRFSVLDLEYEL